MKMKNLKISNELLNYVFTDNLQSFKVDKIENNTLYYFWLNEGFYGDESYCKWEKQNINIYEFAFKCKEWAYNDKSLCGYSIELKSYKSEFGYWLCELISEDITFSGDTEPEAIFAACQWILDNRN